MSETDLKDLITQILQNQKAHREEYQGIRAKDIDWQTRVDGDLRVLREGHTRLETSHHELDKRVSDLREEHEDLENHTAELEGRVKQTSEGLEVSVQADLLSTKSSLRQEMSDCKTAIEDLKKNDGELALALKSAAASGASSAAARILKDRRFRDALVTLIAAAAGVLSARALPPSQTVMPTPAQETHVAATLSDAGPR